MEVQLNFHIKPEVETGSKQKKKPENTTVKTPISKREGGDRGTREKRYAQTAAEASPKNTGILFLGVGSNVKEFMWTGLQKIEGYAFCVEKAPNVAKNDHRPSTT